MNRNREFFEQWVLRQKYFGYELGDYRALERDEIGYIDHLVESAWMGYCAANNKADRLPRTFMLVVIVFWLVIVALYSK